MITLITGLPGHGKTLRLVKEILDIKDRPIRVAGISGLDMTRAKALEFDPTNWHQELPDKCVAFIDECYEYFPARSSHQPPPEFIKLLAKHRHDGLDFFIACQDPSQIDPFLRKLVDRHWHLRRNFGQGFTNVREFQGVNMIAGSERARKEAVQIKQWRLDPKLFDMYESATAHTVKRRFPLKLIGAVAVVVLALGAGINLVAWAMSLDDEETMELVEDGRDLLTPKLADPGQYRLVDPQPVFRTWDDQVNQVRQDYAVLRVEGVEGFPWTAAIYQEVTEPVTFPKPRCILAETRCVCHSQQGTTMRLPEGFCQYYAVNGWFDPTLPDNQEVAESPFSTLGIQSDNFEATEKSRDFSRPRWTNWNADPQPIKFNR